MTKGALIFAINNQIDYTKMAVFAAESISTYLEVNVSIVTNDKSKVIEHDVNEIIDQIIEVNDINDYNKRTFRDGYASSKVLDWKNFNRSSAFDLSPYDETLVIDSDYIINSSKLQFCWNQPNDFLIFNKHTDLVKSRYTNEFDYVSETSVPFYWATVFFFRKNKNTEKFFKLVSYIKENWDYYSLIYNLKYPNFRNDIAFSLAIHIMNGYSIDGNFAKLLPGSLFTTFDTDILVDRQGDEFTFLTSSNDSERYVPFKVNGVDIHIMNKFSLLRSITNE